MQYAIIAVFYISLLGIVAMIFMKRHECIVGKPTWLSYIGLRTDDFFRAGYRQFRVVMMHINKGNVITLTQWISYHILRHIRRLYVLIKHQALLNPHSKKVIDAIRGKGEIRKYGASFYLRRISE